MVSWMKDHQAWVEVEVSFCEHEGTEQSQIKAFKTHDLNLSQLPPNDLLPVPLLPLHLTETSQQPPYHLWIVLRLVAVDSSAYSVLCGDEDVEGRQFGGGSERRLDCVDEFSGEVWDGRGGGGPGFVGEEGGLTYAAEGEDVVGHAGGGQREETEMERGRRRKSGVSFGFGGRARSSER